MKKAGSYILLLLLFCSLLLNGYFLSQRFQTKLPTVTEVIDGDTFVLDSGDHVRLLGVAAPEIDACLGKEAKESLEGYVLGKQVTITEERKDAYGRRMGLVYVESTLVNTKLVEEGLAKPDYTKNSHSQAFIHAYDDAKMKNSGINSEICKKSSSDLPPDATCVIKGNIDKATSKKFYHLPSCRHYNEIVLDLDTKEQYFCSEKEAQEKGFVKASGCE